MPGTRIQAILEEIGIIAHNPRIKELATELGTLLASNVENIERNTQKLTRLQSNTTSAIVDTEATLEDRIVDLRTAVKGLTQLFKRRMSNIEARNDTITDRVHTLSNHMMAVESKVNELSELVMQIANQLTFDADDSYATTDDIDDTGNVDDQSLIDPYATERS